MAARRLLIVMLVLLGISSVIAIVVPEPNRDDPPPEETTVTGETGATGTTGSSDGSSPETGESETDPTLLEKSVNIDSGKPSEIKAKPGSRVILTVRSKTGTEVEIEGLGLSGFADPYAPAVFDLILPSDPGRYQVKPPDGKPGAVIVTS